MTSADTITLKKDFEEKGYVVIDTNLETQLIDGVVSDLSPYFGDNREHPIHAPSADEGRIQDAWYISQNVLALAHCETVLDILKQLYGAEAKPFQTLNFYKGTEQAVHVDSVHFNCEPFGMMCGVWIALEDIGPDQGPLIYYPGSHELPEMNYDYFGLEGNYDNYRQYLDGLHALIDKHGYKPEYGILKKGQAVIWSANIIHGGSHQVNKELTRHSQVTHYYMGNPKCWRPSMTKNPKRRHYFKPEVVRDVSGEPLRYPLQPLSIKRPIDFCRRATAEIKRRIFNRS